MGAFICVPLADKNVGNINKVMSKLNNPFILSEDKIIDEIILKNNLNEDERKFIRERFINISDLKKYHKEGQIYVTEDDDIVMIQFSSGSTGDPKGVMITNKNLRVNIEAMVSGFKINKKDKMLYWIPLTFDFGLIACHMLSVVYGIDQIIMKTDEFLLDPVFWLETISKYKGTLISSPSFGYKLVLDNLNELNRKDIDLSSVRVIMNGGEPVSIDLCNDFLDKLSFYNLNKYTMLSCYGLAEGTLSVTLPHNNIEGLKTLKIDRNSLSIGEDIKFIDDYNALNIVSSGEAVSSVKLRITDLDRKELSEGKFGLVEIKGESVTKGYYNDEEKTKEVLSKDGWFNTGDLGFLYEGKVYIAGRYKDLIIVNGENYYGSDLESIIVNDFKVSNAIIQTNENKVIAFIESGLSMEEFLILENKVKEILNEKSGITVDKIIPIPKLPRTNSGKIQKFKLKQAFETGEFNKTIKEVSACLEKVRYLEDTNLTETEKKVKDIICKVLKLDDIGIKENLYYYGINSLKSILIKGKIEREFNKKVNMNEILKTPFVRDISKAIDKIEEGIKDLKINKLGDKNYYKASAAEARMYMMQQLSPESTFYNLPAIFKLEGNFSKDKFNTVFEELIKRHEALRTHFDVVNGEIVGRIDENYNANIRITKGQITIEDKIREFVKPFNLNNGPLYRGEIFENDECRYLLIDIHHIIADGMSMDMIFNEFKEIYNGNALSDIEFQYKDYAAWSNDLIGTEEIKKQEQFHINNLSDDIPELKLPLDFKRPSKQSFEGSSVNFTIDKKLTESIVNMSKSTSSTVNMILLSAFNILLSKLSMQEVILVGNPVSGRTRDEFKNIFGMFVNTLVLRNKPEGEKTFKDFLIEVKENLLNVYENQDYQFDALVDALNIKKDESRNPIFDVMFNYLDEIGTRDIDLNDMVLENVMVKKNTSQFDITLDVKKDKDNIICNLEYCTKLFKENTMKRFADCYVKILREVTSNVSVKIKEIEIISDEDKDVVLNKFNNTDKAFSDKTIDECFKEMVSLYKDREALVFRNEKLTYEELDKKSDSLAYELMKKGVKKEV